MTRKVLFLDSFSPWTARHEECLASFLAENKGREVVFGILRRKDPSLSQNDIEAILSLCHKDIKTISVDVTWKGDTRKEYTQRWINEVIK